MNISRLHMILSHPGGLVLCQSLQASRTQTIDLAVRRYSLRLTEGKTPLVVRNSVVLPTYVAMRRSCEAQIDLPVIDKREGEFSPCTSVDKLHEWLEERLPKGAMNRWGGMDGSKSIMNLWIELMEGDSSLQDCIPAKRLVDVVCVRILNESGQELIESHQEMESGVIRVRNRPLSEKIRSGESVKEACFRGIQEELGIYGLPENITLFPETYTVEIQERISGSYPALHTRYHFHKVQAKVSGLPGMSFCTEESEHPEAVGQVKEGTEVVKPIGVHKHFWVWRNL